MNMNKVMVSPQAQNQLAKLYNAYLKKHILLAEYQELRDWFDQAVIRELELNGFANFGIPATILFGLWTSPGT
jgi:hypothetical protein